MGTFRAAIQVGDTKGEHFVEVSALVDTGATYTVIPRPILEELRIKAEETCRFSLADGREVEYPVGQALVRINGRTRHTIVVFGEAGAEPLLGAYTLEGFLLAPDPVGKRLIPVPGLLKTLIPGFL